MAMRLIKQLCLKVETRGEDAKVDYRRGDLSTLGVAIWVRIRLFDSIRNELNGFGFEKIDSFNK